MSIINGTIVNGTITTALKATEQASAASVTIGCFLAVLGGCIASCANMLLKYTQLKVQISPHTHRERNAHCFLRFIMPCQVF